MRSATGLLTCSRTARCVGWQGKHAVQSLVRLVAVLVAVIAGAVTPVRAEAAFAYDVAEASITVALGRSDVGEGSWSAQGSAPSAADLRQARVGDAATAPGLFFVAPSGAGLADDVVSSSRWCRVRWEPGVPAERSDRFGVG